MQVEMTDIQLIAAYAINDAITTLYPKAKINLGAEIVREGGMIAQALDGNYDLMRQMILNFVAPIIGEIAKRQDEVAINYGYLMSSGALTMNVRSTGGARYFNIDQSGHIGEGAGQESEEADSPISADQGWGGKW